MTNYPQTKNLQMVIDDQAFWKKQTCHNHLWRDIFPRNEFVLICAVSIHKMRLFVDWLNELELFSRQSSMDLKDCVAVSESIRETSIQSSFSFWPN